MTNLTHTHNDRVPGRCIPIGLFACAIFVCLPALLNGFESPTTPAPDQAALSEPDDVQDLLFLADDRPVFIRLRLLRDGQGFRAKWHEFVEKMFRDLDANGDGVLSGDELDRISSPDLLVEGNATGAPQGADSARANIDVAPADGQITPREFADYLKRVGGTPLSLTTAVENRNYAYGPGASGSSLESKELLFSRLDSDKNNRISKSEFAQAHEVLKRYDINEDETFDRNELLPSPNVVNFPVRSQPNGPARPAEFLPLPAGKSSTSIARKMLDCYDGTRDVGKETDEVVVGDDLLSRDELRIAPELFDRCDANHDGRIDFDEVQELLQDPAPDLEITVRIGMRKMGEPPIEVLSRNPELPANIRGAGSGLVSVVVAGTQLEIQADDAAGRASLADFFMQQFQAADADKNKYLERSEVKRNPVFSQTFDAIDADGDGKLFENELRAFVERREQAARGLTVMNVFGQRRDLFEILDTNRDGRLSRREFLNAARQLTAWDKNGDGELSRAEIPQHFRIRFGQAPANIPGAPLVFAAPQPGWGQPGPNPPRMGPNWFQKMDKNRDGDISRREFLGSRAAFDRLDTNHDDLIDASEAEAAK